MLFISKTLPYSSCECVRTTPQIVTFVIGKMKYETGVPRPKMRFTYVVNAYSDMSLSKGHLGSRRKASKNKLKNQLFPL